MSITPEGKVKRAISKELNRLGAYYFMPVQNGMGQPALDYMVCFRGKFFTIEAKAPGRSPTNRQWATMERVRTSGGVAIVVDSVESAKNLEATMLLCLDHNTIAGPNPGWTTHGAAPGCK